MPSAKCGGFRNQEVGKFLVVRRDGTIPAWTWLVLGALDPHAPAALRAYADSINSEVQSAIDHDHTERAKELRAYANDIYALAYAFERERFEHTVTGGKVGDPEKGPHRQDCEAVLLAMKPNAGSVLIAAVYPRE